MYEIHKESNFGPENKLRALKFFIPGVQMAPETFDIFWPLLVLIINTQW